MQQRATADCDGVTRLVARVWLLVLERARTKGSSIAVIGPTADLMPAAPTNERSRGFGQRNTISPLDVSAKAQGRRPSPTPPV